MAMTIQVVGHRGASGYAPETTIASYQMAIQMGADFVETDVHRSRDGVWVAIHDADVSRTTNGKGFVADHTLAELKALDAGSWFNKAFPEKAQPDYIGLRVPALQEVMEVVQETNAGLFIEIKEPESYQQSADSCQPSAVSHQPDIESALLSLIRSSRMKNRIRVLSFSAESLRKIKELDASVPTVFLVAKPNDNPVRTTMDVPADELGILHTLATPALVEEAHRSGLLISVWTVDHPEDMKRMMALGVDRITTNYPDRLIRLLR
jgi:glycerophosphoryl diester phosphodiesterase